MNGKMERDRRVIAYIFASVIVISCLYAGFTGRYDPVLVVIVGGLATNILLLLGVTRVSKGDDTGGQDSYEKRLVERIRAARDARYGSDDEGQASSRRRARGLGGGRLGCHRLASQL